ncbi:MAG: sulfatase [Planctomycetota bacterium]
MINNLFLSLAIMVSTVSTAIPILADDLNVLFIAVDDLRPELRCYGTEGLSTPNFDQLANSGVRFDRAYCQQAVCGASRLSIMGGLYPTKTREQTFHIQAWRKRHPDLLTMNQHFKNNGFRTIGMGKIFHGTGGPDVDPKNWDQWIRIPGRVYADPTSFKMSREYNKEDKNSKRGPATECLDVADDQYSDGRRTAKAVEVIGRLANSKKRFFLAVGFTKPHLPFVAPKKYWDLYDRSRFSMPENTKIPPGYPVYAANQKASELRAYSDIQDRLPTEFPQELNRKLLHGYAACTSYTDACLGQILTALKQSGLAENTIVVLWGDHGWKLGDHSSWAKHTNFECDTRVPLLIRVPGQSAGKSTDSLIELIDLYPTLCQLTGITIPKHCQGQSFAKLFDDTTLPHRTSAYSSYPGRKLPVSKIKNAKMKSDFRKEIGHSIRFGDYRYTEWRPFPADPATVAVLTDLNSDPGEVTNVIDEEIHADALKRARSLLEQRVLDAIGTH